MGQNMLDDLRLFLLDLEGDPRVVLQCSLRDKERAHPVDS